MYVALGGARRCFWIRARGADQWSGAQIFGVLNRTIRTPLGVRPKDEETSQLYQTYILNFVNHENPNGASSGSSSLLLP